jgi:hypothetical protein
MGHNLTVQYFVGPAENLFRRLDLPGPIQKVPRFNRVQHVGAMDRGWNYRRTSVITAVG